MIELWLLASFSFAGMLIGMLVGLIPGLGVSSTFLLMSPLLIHIHPVYGLFVFVSLLISSQYFGSITALTYGVPGEVSSYPVIAERKNLLHMIDDVLEKTAVGSLTASVAAMAIFVVLMALGNFWVYIYNYRIFAWVLALAVVATILFGSRTNSAWLNAVLFSTGFALAKVGFNKDIGQSWGDFGITELYTGIPLTAIALGLLIVPTLLTQHKSPLNDYQSNAYNNRPTSWPSIGRGTVLGLIGGLVPGVTYMASTQLSYFVENWLNRNRQDRSSRAVVATSSADNAGAVSSLYPLIWLGIPISLGEAVVVWLFDKNNIPLAWTTLEQQVHGIQIYWLLVGCFLLVNLASYALSWPGRRISIRMANLLLSNSTRYVIFGLTFISIALLSFESFSQIIFWITFVVFSTVGVASKRYDWMPLIIGFILQGSIELTLLKIGLFNL